MPRSASSTNVSSRQQKLPYWNYVDLTGQLSNYAGPLDRLLHRKFAQVSPKEPKRPRQKHVQLSRQKQNELIERFKAGALQRELAEAYGVHRTTVAAILRRRDKPIEQSASRIGGISETDQGSD